MNRKSIIQIIVIVICLGAAGYVLYSGFFKGSAPEPLNLNLPGGLQPGALVENQGPVTPPVPFGGNLSAELKRVLARNNLQYNLVVYPNVSPAEVGVPVDDLIAPAPSGEPVVEEEEE